MSRALDPNLVDVVRLRQHFAVHESGHAVVGMSLGLNVLSVRLGLDEAWETGGTVMAGTEFVEALGDVFQLARAQPREMAVVAWAGICAEEAILKSHIQHGWDADFEMLRIGLRWLDPLRPDQQEQVLAYKRQAEAVIAAELPAIRAIAAALLEAGALYQGQVHGLMALQSSPGSAGAQQ